MNHSTTASAPQPTRRKRFRLWVRAVVLLILVGGCWAAYQYILFMRPPTERLGLQQHYSSLPPGPRAHYINRPLDHTDLSKGEFRGFYMLSPGYTPDGPVVFFLTDGQMELVGPALDFEWFERYLGGVSYVLIGRRGHSPTLFPEVYGASGEVDFEEACKLYGSQQHVHDIEHVRRDLLSKGLLPDEGKIALFGASGAGFLVQQYLSSYGEFVSRALIEHSGAPDLARANDHPFIRDFQNFSPEAASTLAPVLEKGEVDQRSLSYWLYQTARGAGRPRQQMLEAVQRVVDGERKFEWGLVGPSRNFSLASRILKAPAADAVKVRMFELLAGDLARFDNGGGEFHLVYSWANEVLADYMKAQRSGQLALPSFELDRAGFQGEVLVIAGTEDVVFSVEIARSITAAYSDSKLLTFPSPHRLLRKEESARRSVRLAFFREGLTSPELQRGR